MESTADSEESVTASKLPKNCKENRYYYRHREEILERQRLARLAKKGVDITKLDGTKQTSLEERRKKKMEFLGLLESQK
jgi:hypothetical protein